MKIRSRRWQPQWLLRERGHLSRVGRSLAPPGHRRGGGLHCRRRRLGRSALHRLHLLGQRCVRRRSSGAGVGCWAARNVAHSLLPIEWSCARLHGSLLRMPNMMLPHVRGMELGVEAHVRREPRLEGEKVSLRRVRLLVCLRQMVQRERHAGSSGRRRCGRLLGYCRVVAVVVRRHGTRARGNPSRRRRAAQWHSSVCWRRCGSTAPRGASRGCRGRCRGRCRRLRARSFSVLQVPAPLLEAVQFLCKELKARFQRGLIRVLLLQSESSNRDHGPRGRRLENSRHQNENKTHQRIGFPEQLLLQSLNHVWQLSAPLRWSTGLPLF